MEYTKKEFEAIVLAGILWEEIVDMRLEFKEESSIFEDHKVELNQETARCPLCTMFYRGRGGACGSCPLEVINQSCIGDDCSLFNEWVAFPTTDNAKAVLEGIYKGSDECSIKNQRRKLCQF